MKKLLGFVLLLVVVIVAFVYVKINKPYSDIINMNWSIKLSNSYKEIYSKDSGASFHGDGDRYHIFQYTNDNDIIQSLNWENSEDT